VDSEGWSEAAYGGLVLNKEDVEYTFGTCSPERLIFHLCDQLESSHHALTAMVGVPPLGGGTTTAELCDDVCVFVEKANSAARHRKEPA
jgi:hypothetical protein